MFKYNELSDLLDGTLVKPLSKMEDGSICCIDSNGNECFYEFDDFDFDKTVEERRPPENNPTIKDIIDKINIDDSTYDGTDDTEIIENPEIIQEEEKEGFLTKEETISIENYLNIKVQNIWRDII